MTARCAHLAFPGAITPGTIDQLLASHRATFGDARMEAENGEVTSDADKGADAGKDKAKEFQPVTSQEEFDRRLSERLAREREKFADYADLKKKAEAHDKAIEAAMSDAEKAVAAARREGETAATAAANARIIRAEARALAATANFRDPGDAVAFLNLGAVKVDEDGEVDAKAIKDQLAELATTKPYLVDDGKRERPKTDRAQGGATTDKGDASVAAGQSLWERRHAKKTTA